MITKGFVILLWFKMFSAAGMPQPLPKVYPSKAVCEKAALALARYYNGLYDPDHQYHTGDIADAHCI